MTSSKLTALDSLDALNQSVLNAFLDLANASIEARGVFRVSLSGGSTPKKLYQSLSQESLDWNRIEWYWGDERNVPHEHADSNFRMVQEALLGPAKIPTSQVFAVPVEPEDPRQAAISYESTLRQKFGNESPFPEWDLVLLGMGDDAHTASLFPETKALEESKRWFVENWVEKFNAYRYTLTAPAINSGREIWFLIAGANKQEPLKRVRSGDHHPNLYPSQLIQPTRWFVTNDALG
jgi:6-phosphogluconolactonase